MDSILGSTKGNTVEIFTKKMIEELMHLWFKRFDVSENYFETTIVKVFDKIDLHLEVLMIGDIPFTSNDPAVTALALSTEPQLDTLFEMFEGKKIGPDELEIAGIVVAAISYKGTIEAIQQKRNIIPPGYFC